MQTTKSICATVFLLLFLLLPSTCMFAQIREKVFMEYYIDGKDTVYLQKLPPAYAFGKKKGKAWRKYYRLVHNFAKAYPYALLAKEKIIEADSTIAFESMNRRQRERYISRFQDDLFETFEKPLRRLTVTQGKLLLRLIDREVGITSYNIIRNYKGKAAAGFWQGIARLFGSDMKKPYDRDGIDKDTEELVTIYQRGEFRLLYCSIFGNDPPEPVEKARNDWPQM